MLTFPPQPVANTAFYTFQPFKFLSLEVVFLSIVCLSKLLVCSMNYCLHAVNHNMLIWQLMLNMVWLAERGNLKPLATGWILAVLIKYLYAGVQTEPCSQLLCYLASVKGFRELCLSNGLKKKSEFRILDL